MSQSTKRGLDQESFQFSVRQEHDESGALKDGSGGNTPLWTNWGLMCGPGLPLLAATEKVPPRRKCHVRVRLQSSHEAKFLSWRRTSEGGWSCLI